MRSVSGPRNRLVLIVAAVIALLGAVWLASGALGLTSRWPAAAAVLPRAESTPATIATTHQQWLLPVAAALAVIVVLLGIWLLVKQVPTRPASAPLRLAGQGTATLGTLSPSVLERALADHVEGTSGVLDATVQMSGSTTRSWIQASVTISQDAEASWVIGRVREILAEDVTTVLSTPPQQVDLLVSLRSQGTSTRTRLDTAESSRAQAQENDRMATARA